MFFLEVTAMLTHEDFQALGQMMDERIGRLMDERLGRLMDERIGPLMDEKLGRLVDEKLSKLMDDKLAPIRADIAELRGRLDENEKSIRSLSASVAENEKSIRRVNQSVVVLEKEVKHDFKIIRENSGNWNERNRQIDRLQKTQEDHHDRIWALEQVAKASNQ
jgi:predicted RNase H-like nuclease (RuvC/YqgF family)